jgi:hypothetical protein
MARLLRIYFNAMFGALGGLFGWLLFGEFVHVNWEWYEQALVGGLLIGAIIGYFVVSVDAILDRAPVRFCRYATFGIVVGGIGGAIGCWLGDWVNKELVPVSGDAASVGQTLGVVFARGLGWMFFGLAVGVSEGIASRSLGKITYGAIGGCLGGFIGGAVFGYLMVLLKPGDASYVWGQAIGLIILGACIGALTALVEEVMKPAALKVVRGWQEGREYPVLKGTTTVGRDEGVDILLLRDMKIEKRHLLIHRRGNRYVLVNNDAPPRHTLVNGEPVAQSCELHDGDRIQLGNVALRFLVKGGRGSSKV